MRKYRRFTAGDRPIQDFQLRRIGGQRGRGERNERKKDDENLGVLKRVHREETRANSDSRLGDDESGHGVFGRRLPRRAGDVRYLPFRERRMTFHSASTIMFHDKQQ